MRKERLPESDRKRSECPVRDEEARIQMPPPNKTLSMPP